MLGGLEDPRPAASSAKDAADDEKPSTKDAAPSTLTALQSLEAALAALGAPAATSASATPAVATSSSANAAAAPLASALAAATGALGAGATSAAASFSTAIPLKTQLQADPTLGLRSFQMKTFLAAAGATPARAGQTKLAPDSAWSPLETPEAAVNASGAPAAPAGMAASAGGSATSASVAAAGGASSPRRGAVLGGRRHGGDHRGSGGVRGPLLDARGLRQRGDSGRIFGERRFGGRRGVACEHRYGGGSERRLLQ